MDNPNNKGNKKIKERGRSLATSRPTTRQPAKTGWAVQVAYEPDAERVQAGVREMLLRRQKGNQDQDEGVGGAVGAGEQSPAGEGRDD